jgi:DHA1 family bicyclomycin/chloramphenicol resistance-like MFS transporter
MMPAAGPGAGSPARRATWGFAALLASLSMMGPFAVDMYLPAFPALGTELGVGVIALQQTLSIYLFAFAFMLLWHGALTDAWGRRPVVIGGLAVFGLATLGCAIAGNIESMWLFRALQGVSAGTGMVVGRAIIRDLYQGAEAQRLMSRVTLLFGIAPALAPVIGGALLNVLGWRSIFWFMLAWVGIVLAYCVARLPETLPPSRRHAMHPRVLWHNYRNVLLRLDFLLLAMIAALNFCAFFLYIAVAPAFLVNLLGVSTLGFAWLFVPMIGGIMLGATMSGHMAGKHSPQATIRLGYTLMAAGVVLNLAISFGLPADVRWNVPPIFILCTGTGLMTPSITLMLLDLFPTMRGMAASLQGFVQFATGGFIAATVAPLLAVSLTTLALGMAAFTVASFVLWLVYQRRARLLLKGWTP